METNEVSTHAGDIHGHLGERPRWPSSKVSVWGRRAPVSKPDSTEDPPCMGPLARQITRSGQTSSHWRGVEAWRGGASTGLVLVI
ncbi:hypothetical protein AVEN_182913-1 [Araneus ventricosus]|uniref:Uncharacterized protein n=1 Tax=Araneus ventricosus TaxID=182803 RepID=A0A4Y2R513_ARAVE|nr:hypothetical protein AVEN_182913-1 [Araneus ventricosus]